MKFGRLLAAGKSLVNGNVAGRYQMNKALAVPQFFSPKNPFKQEAAAQPVASPEAAAPAKASPAAAPVVDAAPAARTPWAGRLKSLAGRAGGALHNAALFCLDHNPFSAIGKPRLAGVPRFGRPATQSELSLDRVQVVRNDLAHADLEVVRAASGPK